MKMPEGWIFLYKQQYSDHDEVNEKYDLALELMKEMAEALEYTISDYAMPHEKAENVLEKFKEWK